MSMLILQIESDTSTDRVCAAQIESASAQIESDTVMHRFTNSSRSTRVCAAQIESASAQIESDTVMHRFTNSSRSKDVLTLGRFESGRV